VIEMLEDFPEGVVAAVAKGRVTRADYDQILIPAVEAAFRHRQKVRCYYELGREFSGMDAGAVWEDFRVGFTHLSGWGADRRRDRCRLDPARNQRVPVSGPRRNPDFPDKRGG